jgi:hypothetical protein
LYEAVTVEAAMTAKQWVEFLGEKPDDETTRVELGETAAV